MKKTTHPLHFEDLGWSNFERLVFAYVVKTKQWDVLEWLGETGADNGRDIWGEYQSKSYCYQCANYRKLTLKKVTDDIDKMVVQKLVPDFLTIVCGGSVTSKTRLSIHRYALGRDIYNTTIWSSAELEEKLRDEQPLLLKRFFEGEIFPEIETQVEINDNLPKIPAFYGRESELKSIYKALSNKNNWGIAINGAGGIGKTTLAVKAAESYAPGKFSRFYFLSVKSFVLDDSGTRSRGIFRLNSLPEIFNSLARLIDRNDITQADEAERSWLLLNALKNSETLLILDNLESLETESQQQLMTFLEFLPSDCKAIITSRKPLGNAGEQLFLDKLEIKAALIFMKSIAVEHKLLKGILEKDYRDLYAKTSGNPLLIRWLIGQVGLDSHRSFKNALDFLQSCPSENDPLEFIFGETITALEHEFIDVLATLSYPKQPITTQEIAEICNLPLANTHGILRKLNNLGFVTSDKAENLYANLPMVNTFMLRKKELAVKKIGRRLIKRAYRMITLNGGENHQGFLILDESWNSIAPALPLFYEAPNEQLQLICDRLGAFLNFTGRWDERLLISRQAEKRAVSEGDFVNAGWVAYEIGYVYYLRRQSPEVTKQAEDAIKYWKKVKNPIREKAYATRLSGLGLRLAGDYETSILRFKKALKMWRGIKLESSDIVVGLTDIADSEKEAENYEAAQDYYLEALQVADRVKYAEGFAYVSGKLAALELAKENWAGAEELAQASLELSNGIGRQESIAEDCKCIAKALLKLKRPEDAYPYALRAFRILNRLKSPPLHEVTQLLRQCQDETRK